MQASLLLATCLAGEPFATRDAQASGLDRDVIVFEIVSRMAPAAQARGYGDWEEEVRAALMTAHDEILIAAREADSYEAVISLLSGTDPEAAATMAAIREGLASPLALGDLDRDLTFSPLTPCRIVDTRLAGGPILPGTIRKFDARGVDLSYQGGGSCANLADDPSAIAINVTVTSQAGAGHLTIWPEGVTQPDTSTLNYTLGIDLANSTIIESAYLLGWDFQISSIAQTHLIVDLLGVFTPPEINLTTQQVSNSESHTAQFDMYSPSCPTGTVYTGSGHGWLDRSETDIWFSQVDRDGTNSRTRCQGQVDRGGASSTITCTAHCLGL